MWICMIEWMSDAKTIFTKVLMLFGLARVGIII